MTDDKKENSEVYRLNPYILKTLIKEVDSTANIVPDITFVGFSMYTMLLAEVCRDCAYLLPQSPEAAGFVENIDSACTFVIGVGQIMQPKAEPIANRVKGVTNIMSVAQLYWLASLGLGPIGVIANLGLAFVRSLYDLAKTIRRINDFDYWVEDTTKELEYLKSEKAATEASINDLINQKKLEKNAKNSSILKWLIGRREKHLHETDRNILALENVLCQNDITGRILTMQNELLDRSYNTLMLGAAFVGVTLLVFTGPGFPAVSLIALAVILYTNKCAPRVGAFFQDLANYLTSEYNDSDICSRDDDAPIYGNTQGICMKK